MRSLADRVSNNRPICETGAPAAADSPDRHLRIAIEVRGATARLFRIMRTHPGKCSVLSLRPKKCAIAAISTPPPVEGVGVVNGRGLSAALSRLLLGNRY